MSFERAIKSENPRILRQLIVSLAISAIFEGKGRKEKKKKLIRIDNCIALAKDSEQFELDRAIRADSNRDRSRSNFFIATDGFSRWWPAPTMLSRLSSFQPITPAFNPRQNVSTRCVRNVSPSCLRAPLKRLICPLDD